MRWLIGIGSLIVLLLVTLYLLFFSSFGNALVALIAQKKIGELLHVEARLDPFVLRPGRFELSLWLDADNRIDAAGYFSLFSQSFDVAYRVRLNRLESLQSLTQTPLYGTLHTDGTAKGKLDAIRIEGQSDIAASQSRYTLEIDHNTPKNLHVSIQGARSEALLALVGKAPYAQSALDVEAQIASLDPSNLQGAIDFVLKEGSIDDRLMQRDFNITLPKTTFTMHNTLTLQGPNIHYKSNFHSNLAQLSSEGSIAPQSLKTDLVYTLACDELALFAPLTNAPLRGPIATQGSIKGDRDLMRIQGQSNIAQSITHYDVELKAFLPSSVLATIKGAKLEQLLYMIGRSPLASGVLSANIALANLEPNALKGKADIRLDQGHLNSKLMQSDFNVTLPQTTFSLKAHTLLQGAHITYDAALDSNLAKISSKGRLQPQNMGIDLSYILDIAHLEALTPITKIPFKGPLYLSGSAKGERDTLHVKGESNIAKSTTYFTLDLAQMKPKSAMLHTQKLQLPALLHLLGQPHYLQSGVLDLDLDLTDLTPKAFKGSIAAAIRSGVVDGAVVAQTFALDSMQDTPLALDMNATLQGAHLYSSALLNSSLMRLALKRADFDLERSVLQSAFVLDLPDLSKLAFAAKRPLQGTMHFEGTLRQSEHLYFETNTTDLGGLMTLIVDGDDARALLRGVDTLKILHLLTYPEIFTSSIDARLNYHLPKRAGVLEGTIQEGRFMQNTMADLLKQYGNYDLYKERFVGTLKSEIDEKKILSDLSLKGGTIRLSDKALLLENEHKKVHSNLVIDINKNPIKVKIRGTTEKPKVSIDATELIEREASKVIEKELGNLLKKLR